MAILDDMQNYIGKEMSDVPSSTDGQSEDCRFIVNSNDVVIGIMKGPQVYVARKNGYVWENKTEFEKRVGVSINTHPTNVRVVQSTSLKEPGFSRKL